MSPLPSEFVGLWERIRLTVDGNAIHGAGHSLWFQAGERYLDVRQAGGELPAEAFAGITRWDAASATLTWEHELDIHVDAENDDRGRVEWVDGDLVEHGTAAISGTEIVYSEVWRRSSAVAEQVVIADRIGGSGRLAWCGRHGALIIDDRPGGEFTGGTFVDHVSSWQFDMTIGVLARHDTGALPPVVPTNEFEACGAVWQVVEAS